MICIILFSFIALTQCALEKPPLMSVEFEPEYFIPSVKKDTKFACKADGNPAPKITWHFNGQLLSNTELKKIYSNGTLHIIEVQDEPTANPPKVDWGRYQCFAKNKLGKAMGRPFLLKEAENPAFQQLPDQDFSGKQDESATIECVGKNIKCVPKEQCKVEWKIGEATDTAVKTDKRIAVDPEGALHFAYLKQSDQKNTDAEFYSCAVWNEDVQSLVKGPKIKFKVNPPDAQGSTNLPLKHLYNTQKVTAMIGSTAECQCVFAAKPIEGLNIDWKKDNVIVTGNPRFAEDDYQRKLIISNVAEEDEGTYTCEATISDETATSTCVLDVQSPPIFDTDTDKPKALTLPVGEDAVFNCKSRSLADEKSPDEPVWYKNGEQIASGTAKYEFNTDKTTLKVKNVQKPIQIPQFNPQDVGNYVCEVTNTYGTVYGFGSLNVIEPITITQTLEESVTIVPGDVISLAVDATTDPELTLEYVWSFRDVNNDTLSMSEMESSEFYTFTTNKKNLTIDASSLEGSEIYKVLGFYKVVIGHNYEKTTLESKFTTDSTIAPPVTPITVGTAGFDFWIIAVILGIIVLLVVIILIICLCYRNRGGTYPVDKKEVAAGHDPEKELKDSGFHDLSRADDFDNPGYDNVSLSSLKPIESDEDSMGEYGGELDISKFNEDGSFIGLYADKKRPTQSTV